MRSARLALVLVAACSPAAPPAEPASAHAAPSTDARPAPAPTSVDTLPADWLACTSDGDCVAVPSACCAIWPSSVAYEGKVREVVHRLDAARGNCTQRACELGAAKPACSASRCAMR